MSAAPGLPRDWIPTLLRFLEREPVVARVVVTEARGSTPREPGAFMLVGRDSVEGSIGGGRLEWEAIAAARDLLADLTAAARLNKVVLAADVGQCCGGVVSVWLEKFTPEDLPVLHAAAEAGARGRAVLVSEVTPAEVHRRVVAPAPHRRPQPATADINPANAAVSDRAIADPPRRVQPAMANISPANATVSDRALADSPRRAQPDMSATAPSATPTAIEHLLRQPRQLAGPIVLVAGAVTVAPAAANRAAAAPSKLTFIERLDDDLPAVWLYGAGHVGQALARILMELPLRLTWIDSRAELFPQPLPDSVRVLRDDDSVATVSEAPVGAYFVVMSHSHPLDFELCHALLERNDFAWLGLIGSDSKAARFRSRLARTGLGADVIAKLVCPIGVEGITSKWPAAIAVAVAAQLMQKISSAAERPEVLPSMALPPKSAKVPRPPSLPTPVSPDVPCAHELCATCGTPAAPSHAASRADTAGPANSTVPGARPGTVATCGTSIAPDGSAGPASPTAPRPDTVTS